MIGNEKGPIGFGQCLKGILENKGVSASELARLMEYKSRNTVFRILDEEGGESARLAFYDRLTGENSIGLDEEEKKALEVALEVSRVGVEGYRANLAMQSLLMQSECADSGEMFRISGMNESEENQIIPRISLCSRVDIVITGCCDRALLGGLRRQILASPGCRVSIQHFIYAGKEEIIQNMSAIQPLMFLDCYSARGILPGMLSAEREQVYRSNCLYIRWEDPQDGKVYDQPIILVDKKRFLALGRREKGAFSGLEKLLAEDKEKLPRLKKVLGSGADMLDYGTMAQRWGDLEKNRAIYLIKPEIPGCLVHAQIARDCLNARLLAKESVSGEEMRRRTDELIALHDARYQNLRKKKKPTHIILSRTAMEQFARTGMESDHFFAFRAYTPKERVRILEDLRSIMAENPGFRIYFLRDGFEPRRSQMCLFDGEGVMMFKPETDYNLAGVHAEAMVTQAAFCEQFKSFFTQDLLKRRVTSEKETQEVLSALIEIASAQEADT